MGTRLGLIAVSGVRIYNDRLTRVGLTLPGFYERAHTIASMPSLGLLTLAAVTPEGFDIDYVESPSFDAEKVAATDYDIVGISSFTAKCDVMYRIADAYRARGHHRRPRRPALHAPARGGGGARGRGGGRRRRAPVAAPARGLAPGEAAEVLPQPGLPRREPGRRPRAALRPARLRALQPHPRPDHARLPAATASSARASKIFGGYKLKPVEPRGARHPRDQGALARRPFIELADDNTFVNKAWSRELVPRDRRRRRCAGSPRPTCRWRDDPELLDLLARSGLPPGADRVRVAQPRVAGRHRGARTGRPGGTTSTGASIDELQGARRHRQRLLHRRPRRRHARTSSRRSSASSRSALLIEVQVTVLTPFPGTALYARLQAEGRLLASGSGSAARCSTSTSARGMTVEELEQGLEHVMTSLYSAAETRRRRLRYVELIRSRRKENAA